MHTDGLDIILGFFEGFALIISPCILPILPIVLASSLAGSKKRPFGITLGFVMTFACVAFFSRQVVHLLGFDLHILRMVSYTLLVLLGAIMLSAPLTAKISQLTQRLINHGFSPQQTFEPADGFFSGLMYGSLIALVWTPCAGPILAAVIVQTVIQQSTLISFITLLTFTVGAALPMLLIALYGKHIINQLPVFKIKSVLFRKLLGLIIIASVGYMIIQERAPLTSSPVETQVKTATRLQQGLWIPYQAPVLSGISTWINSSPLELSALKGHVVLIDFWTYSCINCIRTLPYLKHFYQEYHDKGLVIIGVHSPEFDFEKNPDHVKRAVERDGINYPVALDNQFMTWRNFNNHYWPAHYLINQQGQVVYTHFGEGDYDVMENNIRFLLGINSLAIPSMNTKDAPNTMHQTQETYLGYARANSIHGPSLLVHDTPSDYTFPSALPAHAWGLKGTWQVKPDKIIATHAQAKLTLHFNARIVYVVMGAAGKKTIPVNVRIDNADHPLIQQETKNPLIVGQQSIYTLATFPHATDGILTLTTEAPGLMLYTFTFGS